MTQRQIAKAIGVSCATVANILSGKPGLRYSQETRDRVITAAAEMGYQQNRASRVIRTGRSNLIGIVHFGVDVEAARRSNEEISKYCCAAGYHYHAVDMNWHGGSVERTLNELIQARVEGVIISHIQEVFSDKHIEVLTKASIPVVSLNGDPRRNVSLICDNVEKAIYELTKHLLKLGHRRLVHLGSQSGLLEVGYNRSVNHRMKGFRHAIEEKQRGVASVFPEEEFFRLWPEESLRKSEGIRGFIISQDRRLYDLVDMPVYRFCKRLFASGALPDAIVCPNDMYAMEVIAAGLECGIRIPDDIALTGYDNDRIGRFPAFGLTTAEQNSEALCSAAVKTLIERIKNPRAEVVEQTYDSKLIFRTSCGRGLPKRTLVKEASANLSANRKMARKSVRNTV